MYDMKQLGAFVVKERKRQGVTQLQLSQAADVGGDSGLRGFRLQRVLFHALGGTAGTCYGEMRIDAGEGKHLLLDGMV